MPKEEPENDLCRCCHAEGSFKNLYESHSWMDVEEVVYSKLLQDCFEIEMAPVTQPLQHMLCTICETCIERLQDAVKFKRQVLKCEKRFRDVYGSCVGKESTYEVKVKQEVELDLKDDTFNGESSKTSALADSFRGMDNDDDDDDDDDGFGDREDDNSKSTGNVRVKEEVDDSDSDDNICLKDMSKLKKRKAKGSSPSAAQKKPKATTGGEKTGDHEELEVIQENVPEADKAKRKKNTSSSPKKKKRQSQRATEDEEEIGTIDGISVVKNGARVKKDIDYKATEDKTYHCLKCPLVTKSLKVITVHVKGIHLCARYKCPNCYENFLTVAQLVKHKLDEHNIDQRFKCQACDKAFYEKSSLTHHVNGFHMLGGKMKCKECNFETFNKNSLRNHKSMHTTEKNYKCDYCQKAFRRKTSKTQHEKIHTGDKRKVCTECGKAYIDRTSLKYHMTRHHPEIAF